MNRFYSYVGPPEIARAVNENSLRVRIDSAADVQRWTDGNSANPVTTTFIVDANGTLWIADRRSEHVACARGGLVQSAGELTFDVRISGVNVVYASNQSTGYCPEPESWNSVTAALDAAGIGHFDDFDMRCEFRRCQCGQINIVKDAIYECAICGSELPREWNLRLTCRE